MRNIKADVNRIKGKTNRFYLECVGAGRAAELLRKDALDQLKIVREECGFKYLRFHGLFHEDMAVYTEDREGNSIYNWQYIDIVYDSILEIGMKPFVELSFMPYDLASGEKTVFWWKGNITPPKDYNKWYSFIYEFILHIEKRYGREEILTWYFEVWNEPNLDVFFTGTMAEYYKLYEITVNAIKDVCSEYRVGGPATAASAWIKDTIGYCDENNIPIDFVSTHSYGVKGDFDEFWIQKLYLDDKDVIIEDVKRVNSEVKSSNIPELEIHYTEWNSSYSSRDAVHDCYIQAPFILYNLKHFDGLINSASYWTFTDIFEEAGPGPTPFHGGFGLINIQGLKKPAFYAYKFLNELGNEELLNNDSDSYLCKSDEGIQCLIWNYSQPKQDTHNNEYFKRDLPAKKAETAEVNVIGIDEGKYLLQVSRVGYEKNDVYTEYYKMNLKDTPVRGEIIKLKNNNGGKPFISKIVEIKRDEVFRYHVDLNENDVYFIKLIRKDN